MSKTPEKIAFANNNQQNSIPESFLDDEFIRLMLDVETVYQQLPKHDRIKIELWTKKLCQVTTNIDWKKNRNRYAKSLLNQVQNGKLQAPFLRQPKDGPLPRFNKLDVVSVRLSERESNWQSLRSSSKESGSRNTLNSTILDSNHKLRQSRQIHSANQSPVKGLSKKPQVNFQSTLSRPKSNGHLRPSDKTPQKIMFKNIDLNGIQNSSNSSLNPNSLQTFGPDPLQNSNQSYNTSVIIQLKNEIEQQQQHIEELKQQNQQKDELLHLQTEKTNEFLQERDVVLQNNKKIQQLLIHANQYLKTLNFQNKDQETAYFIEEVDQLLGQNTLYNQPLQSFQAQSIQQESQKTEQNSYQNLNNSNQKSQNSDYYGQNGLNVDLNKQFDEIKGISNNSDNIIHNADQQVMPISVQFQSTDKKDTNSCNITEDDQQTQNNNYALLNSYHNNITGSNHQIDKNNQNQIKNEQNIIQQSIQNQQQIDSRRNSKFGNIQRNISNYTQMTTELDIPQEPRLKENTNTTVDQGTEAFLKQLENFQKKTDKLKQQTERFLKESNHIKSQIDDEQ